MVFLQAKLMEKLKLENSDLMTNIHQLIKEEKVTKINQQFQGKH